MLSVISVIDDDASVRAATDNLLSSHGYLVRTFASAEEFLQSPHLHDCACVVADVQMPGMSGLDLLTYMRAQGYLAPFIFITAFPEESVRASRAEGGSHWLSGQALCRTGLDRLRRDCSALRAPDGEAGALYDGRL